MQQNRGNSGGQDNSGCGFNGEPLSFAPERSANGAVRRTRTDNSIEFPVQTHTTRQEGGRQRSRSAQSSTARRTRTGQSGQSAAGARRTSPGTPKRRVKGNKNAAAQPHGTNRRMRPAAAQQSRDPVRRERRKKRKMTRAAIKRRRMIQRLIALGTLAAVIAAGIYLTMTMLFRIGTIEVQTADGTAVQEVGGYSSDQILQALGVQLEENIFSFDPAAKETELEKQFPLLESIQVVRNYPNTVVVKATEAVPAYAMQTGSGWLTLSKQFKILACESAQPEGLKTLYGGEPASVTPGDQLCFETPQTADSAASGASSGSGAASQPQEDGRLNALQQLQAKLDEYGLLDGVTRIEFEDTDQMAFLYQDRISVLLGTLNELDYKLEGVKTVLTNADGIGSTDTGGLDLSHVRASGTNRRFYLAQGEPTLPSGYVVPEEPEAPADSSQTDEGTADGEPAASTGEPAQDTPAQDAPALTDPARMTANEEENPM
mgnify:FL=1